MSHLLVQLFSFLAIAPAKALSSVSAGATLPLLVQLLLVALLADLTQYVVHHASEAAAIDTNFAVHFPWIDGALGTLYLPEQRWPDGYGIHAETPAGFWGQLVAPFARPRDRVLDRPRGGS